MLLLALLACPTETPNSPVTRQQRIRSLPFQPRVQVVGSIYWLCPACGRCNRAHIAPKVGFRITCGYRGCSAAFRCGWTLWQLPPGSHGAKNVPLDEPFPPAAIGALGRGRYIHRAVDEEGNEQPPGSLEPAACSPDE